MYLRRLGDREDAVPGAQNLHGCLRHYAVRAFHHRPRGDVYHHRDAPPGEQLWWAYPSRGTQTAFDTPECCQFIVQSPGELIDAAKVDGGGLVDCAGAPYRPSGQGRHRRALAISVLRAWNLYVRPLIATSKPSLQVLTKALAPLTGSEYSTVPETVSMPASVIAIFPMFVAFIIARRAFVRGPSRTGLDR